MNETMNQFEDLKLRAERRPVFSHIDRDRAVCVQEFSCTAKPGELIEVLTAPFFFSSLVPLMGVQFGFEWVLWNRECQPIAMSDEGHRNQITCLQHGVEALLSDSRPVEFDENPPRTFRAGDRVLHKPSGETWTLACDEFGGEVAAFYNVLEKIAHAADCTLIRAAADDERRQQLESTASHHIGVAQRMACFQLAALDTEAYFSEETDVS